MGGYLDTRRNIKNISGMTYGLKYIYILNFGPLNRIGADFACNKQRIMQHYTISVRLTRARPTSAKKTHDNHIDTHALKCIHTYQISEIIR